MPRTSFAIWKQTVHLTSQPWLDLEIAAASDLRSSLMEVLIRERERLYHLYADLERSRNELDAFAYVASHDLKEPLRGITNFAKMLTADYADQFDQEGRERLETLVRLSRRMDNLLNSLLQYSRIGRVEDSYEEVDMNVVASAAIESLSARIAADHVDIRIPASLPTVIGSEMRLLEVLMNLISNAIKYNDKPAKWVEIGAEPATPGGLCELYVRDNGIGILPSHMDQIFDIFRRLHGKDEFGGGAGAGLTIVKKIIEVHGGTIWVESILNEQTTFRFTVPCGGSK
jgi:light-regulated signal transduction histidine kinase (bacteriophytochrome)